MTRCRILLGVLTALALCVARSSQAQSITSIKLTDVIRSTGVGSIDLLKDVTPAQLETFRQQGSGALKVGVDVNEAASGTEKSGSQAVTIDTLVLSVTVGGVQTQFNVFSTSTQALLARAGTTVRTPYYTLIGESGANRFTGNALRDTLDAVITVPVSIDLAAATRAVMDVKLLSVNMNLGDPEAFYDYSDGPEILALLTTSDTQFVTQLAPGTSDAPVVIQSDPAAPDLSAVSTLSYPSGGDYYTVGYEDLFPSLGDYDFNDLVVSYRVDLGLNQSGQIVSLSGTAFLIARGAGYSHDWHMGIPNPAGNARGSYQVRITDPATLIARNITGTVSGNIDLPCFTDSRKVFPPLPGAKFTNTELGTNFVVSPRVDFTVTLTTPIAQSDLGAAPFDPYILVRNTGFEVHTAGNAATAGSRNQLEGKTSFVDPAGFPFAFLLPQDWPFPWERTDLGRAYPLLSEYTKSAGTKGKTWYTQPDSTRVRTYLPGSWKWLLN